MRRKIEWGSTAWPSFFTDIVPPPLGTAWNSHDGWMNAPLLFAHSTSSRYFWAIQYVWSRGSPEAARIGIFLVKEWCVRSLCKTGCLFGSVNFLFDSRCGVLWRELICPHGLCQEWVAAALIQPMHREFGGAYPPHLASQIRILIATADQITPVRTDVLGLYPCKRLALCT